MTLQEGPKIDRWYSQVDVLSCVDVQFVMNDEAYFEFAIDLDDHCS